MTRVLLVLGGLIVATALLLGPARGLLPGAWLMSSGNATLTTPGTKPGTGGHQSDTTPASSSAPAALPPGNATLALSTQALAKAADGYTVSAALRKSDGTAVGAATVRFYEAVDLLGDREMLIGSAVTDGTGVASLAYLPARTGTHEIVARTSAAGKVDAAVGRLTFESSVSAPAYQETRKPLASFSDRVPYAVGVLVLGVWSVIAFALLATARGVIGGARSSTQKGETA